MQYFVPDIILKQNHSGLPQKDFLKKVVKDYPYFTPAHFFLLQQSDETDSAYSSQAATTALLFNNPHWLHFQLQQPYQKTLPIEETPVINMYPENEDNDDDNAVLIKQNEIAIPFAQAENVQLSDNTFKPRTQTETTAQIIADTNSDNDDNTAVLVNINEPEQALPDTENIFNISPIKLAPTENAQPEQLKFEENTDNDDDNAVLNTESEVKGMELPHTKIDLAASLKKAEKENALAFEPMHMVDYFASQGIKLNNDVQHADKLGKQLKSFTEWLKTMKKVHPENIPAATESTEIAIQTLAEKSNTESEIITEAMAEVFSQQGKAAKAIEVYQKLSLLNPLKSAYFACKIEQLKED
jgi:hypothetical protein